MLPAGRRRQRLEDGINRLIGSGNACLPLTCDAAHEYAWIRHTRKRTGRPIAGFDALIAAIVRVHDAQLATRNIKDFEGLDIPLINPWH